MLRYLGNLLIFLPVIGFGIIFFPILREEYRFRTQTELPPVNESFGLRIPSIGVSANVVENVNPWQEIEYQAALKQGVAHARGSAVPSESGTVYLFAHSSDSPWNMTRTNTAFFRLNRIKPGDSITVVYQGEEYQYRVNELKEVWPNEVAYLTESTTDQLILQTCTPLGTALKRLLVFAEPI